MYMFITDNIGRTKTSPIFTSLRLSSILIDIQRLMA